MTPNCVIFSVNEIQCLSARVHKSQIEWNNCLQLLVVGNLSMHDRFLSSLASFVQCMMASPPISPRYGGGGGCRFCAVQLGGVIFWCFCVAQQLCVISCSLWWVHNVIVTTDAKCPYCLIVGIKNSTEWRVPQHWKLHDQRYLLSINTSPCHAWLQVLFCDVVVYALTHVPTAENVSCFGEDLRSWMQQCH